MSAEILRLTNSDPVNLSDRSESASVALAAQANAEFVGIIGFVDENVAAID